MNSPHLLPDENGRTAYVLSYMVFSTSQALCPRFQPKSVACRPDILHWKMQDRIKMGIKFIPPHIVTVKTAFTSCYPNVPLRIFHYGRNSSQPPARQINPLKYILRFSLSEKSPVAAYPNIPVPCTKDIRRVQRFQFSLPIRSITPVSLCNLNTPFPQQSISRRPDPRSPHSDNS